MKVLKLFLMAMLLAPVIGPAAMAQELPQPASDTVSDFAQVLSTEEEMRITALLVETRETTGVHMVVVTLPGLPAEEGTTLRIEDYSTSLFNAWGIGDAGRDDGILLLLDMDLREARIALGAGYDPVYNERAARVLSTALLPKLAEGRLAAGIEAGILSSRERLITPFLAGAAISATDGFEDDSGGFPIWTVAGGVFGIAGFLIWRNRRASRTCPKCGAVALSRKREVITPPTRTEAGVGLQHMTCSACGFIDRLSYAIPFATAVDHDRSSSSDHGGFGGGSSSGGGASGKW